MDISKHYSKTPAEIGPVEFDYVVTVCGHANENCPMFPGKTKVVHVGFEDPPRLTKDLPDGEEKLAVYRDESARLHIVASECTHMGCQVRWNSAERSWDCPCHGSRFDVEGNVLQGPAVKPLVGKELRAGARAGRSYAL